MNIAKQISSLEKVRVGPLPDFPEIESVTLLKGEHFSYQIAFEWETLGIHNNFAVGMIEVDSPLSPYIKIYNIENAVMDCPSTLAEAKQDTGYITQEPGLMPDILVPAEGRDFIWLAGTGAKAIWIELNIPQEFDAGKYNIVIKLHRKELKGAAFCDEYILEKKLAVEVIDKEILPQSLIYTRWFYADCIADYHNVEIYSEKHWELIKEYIKQAVSVGVNMILVPVHTPPLDTAKGARRPSVQLVDIKKNGDEYSFSFEKFKRFIKICKECGVKYYEIAHLFSQWGAKYAPNIIVEENGVSEYAFGWHTAADDERYISFLKQYIVAISSALRAEGIEENTYFHISDEPSIDNIDAYKRSSDIIRPLIGNSKTFDALSNYEFYQKGLVECPVTAVEHIDKFLGKHIENQWIYYCCNPETVYPNSFIAMPLSRVRIMGMLIYKYGIKGFLHWGLNFYSSMVAHTHINPYTTTSAGCFYPSGDPFILYPSKDGAYNSMRGKAFYDAIVDINICRTLEMYIGKDKVVELIDSMADSELKFDNYPIDSSFLPALREKMVNTIRRYL